MNRHTRLLVLAVIGWLTKCVFGNLPPIFTEDMNNLALSEATPVGWIVYKLEGYDPEGGDVTFGLIGTDNFAVDPKTGEVTVIKALDRETKDTLSFLVTIKDRINASGGDSEHDNLVQVPIKVIVLDENDVVPDFKNVPYETEVPENTAIGTTIFNSILVTDQDAVGENLNISCMSAPQSILNKSTYLLAPSNGATIDNADLYEPCSKFSIEVIDSNQDRAKAAIILKEKLDYNEQMIYRLVLTATDGIHEAQTGMEIRVKDVQNRPPIFQGSLAAVIDEDSPIGTLVLNVQAKDGDHGQPRRIVYDLLTNPMDYFLLNGTTGELRTARPLDREILPDATGIITLIVRARELLSDGQPGNDNLTTATAQASITIHDVNDSPPMFNKKNYYVSLTENTPIGTPIPIDINVHDPDMGQNSVFALKLDDVSEVFDVEPKRVMGSSHVSIRIANGTLDYENPNQRKFIVLIIAEETQTLNKLSSTATLTVTVTDANDNRPTFEQEAYSFSVSETAPPNHLIGTIMAKDLDSGRFGTQGIRYSISGAGSELFRVSSTGTITLAECQNVPNPNQRTENYRKKRQTADQLTNAKKVNLTIISEAGVLDVDDTTSSTEYYSPYSIGGDVVTYRTHFSTNDDYMVMSDDSDEETTTVFSLDVTTINENHNSTQHLNAIDANSREIETIKQTKWPNDMKAVGSAGHAPCLDYETQNVYFLTYKATDDNGIGQTSVVSLRIMLIDSNDSPPVCESTVFRASLDEGAQLFDPPLFIKVRDADSISDINYRILGNGKILNLFTIDKYTGQLFIKDTMALDVNHLNAENIYFSVEAYDGAFAAVCNVNITIRDVNNHAPKFVRDNYITSIAENTPIGSMVQQVEATDLDNGINAKIRYRIQQGSFDDFVIDNRTGSISIARKLDYDKRENYRIEVVASDLGIPSLSGTATVSINLINSNDKDPFFIPATQRTEVREDASIGKRIYQLVAHDPDVASNDVLAYQVTEPITAVNKNGKQLTDSESFKNLFAVDRYGNVSVNGKLDRDLFAVVRLTVVVTDTTAPTLQQGKGLLVITIIEVNEIPPVFAAPWSPSTPKLMFQMLEEQPIGTKLTQLQASDVDSNIEAFHMSTNDYLEINNLTGTIRTKARIDYESIKQIYVNAFVTDTGVPQLTSTAEIIVDIININDNDPVFTSPEYRFTIAENSPKGAYVGNIDAKDNDDDIFGNISYSLIGDHSKNFNIDSISGIITVQNSSFLDRERLAETSFSVIATDKAPVTTRRSSIVPIHIVIQDVNDNSPVFTQKNYYATVAENAQLHPPAAVLQVNALDADEGVFGEVKYGVVENDGNANRLFQLDSNSGILYPSQSLNGKKGQYKITIEARDGLGFGPNSDTTEVVIDIQSVNNYRPVFIMPALSNASVEVQENLAVGNYLVMTVKATDEDAGENGKIKYYLQVNNQNVLETDEFRIDELTGELKLKKKLNREQQSKYELVLVARDQGMPSNFESLRFLTILIVSVNENKPEFPDASNPYKFFIVENSDRDLRIGKIQAFLRDKDPNIGVYYYMLMGNENGAFYVDKKSGDVFTNRTLDREEVNTYHLYVLASKKSDLHISRRQRDEFTVDTLERDSTVAKIQVKILDVNDNAPEFERNEYYAGISAEASINQLVATINATDADIGTNGTFDLIIVSSNLFKFGSSKSVGSIVPSPFKISKEGHLTTATYMGEYDQDRFELTIIAKEIEHPGREADTKVMIWIYRPDQLVRVIMSRPPFEVMQEKEEIMSELQNATNKRIVVTEIRHHVNGMGRIRMDWCDLYFYAVDLDTKVIATVDDILKIIDSNYDFLRDYYAGFAIENIVPAHAKFVEEEIDLALIGLLALLVVLFVGAISFIVLCCCLKNWSISIPAQTRRKEALIKKQFIDELSTTENPLWIEQKLKMYEEQELTMQVFSEPEISALDPDGIQPASTMRRRDSYEVSGDNTYATIQPRNVMPLNFDNSVTGTLHGPRIRNGSSVSTIGNGEIADYATLRTVNGHPPSTTQLYEFTGSTFQALAHNDDGNYVAEII